MDIALIIIIVVAVIVTIMILSSIYERKRREALQQWAEKRDLRFFPSKDYDTANHYHFLNAFGKGSNRYMRYIIRGTYRQHTVLIGEYHYETSSTDSKGNRSTTHHWLRLLAIDLPRRCPELTIAREGILSKIAQAFGYADIDFESHEFSRRFVVRSKDRRFAYDVIQPAGMEVMLKHIRHFGEVEIEGQTMAFIDSGKLDARTLQGPLDMLVDIRATIPDYVMAETA